MEKTYRINMAAKLSGVSEGLIRAWERRHNLLSPRRTPSGYRIYTETDVEVLRQMRQLTDQGMAISDAVKLLPEIRQKVEAGAPLRNDPSKLPMDRWREGILEAGRQSNQHRIEQIMDEAFAALAPMVVFDQLLAPVLREVGEQWRQGKLTVAQEHLVTQPIRSRLLRLLQVGRAGARGDVLAACYPEEQHEMGLIGAALRFQDAGYRVTYLGARVPFNDLVKMARDVGPKWVAVSVVSPVAPRDLQQVAMALASLRPATRAVMGGIGVEPHRALCEAAGVKVVAEDRDWESLL